MSTKQTLICDGCNCEEKEKVTPLTWNGYFGLEKSFVKIGGFDLCPNCYNILTTLEQKGLLKIQSYKDGKLYN